MEDTFIFTPPEHREQLPTQEQVEARLLTAVSELCAQYHVKFSVSDDNIVFIDTPKDVELKFAAEIGEIYEKYEMFSGVD